MASLAIRTASLNKTQLSLTIKTSQGESDECCHLLVWKIGYGQLCQYWKSLALVSQIPNQIFAMEFSRRLPLVTLPRLLKPSPGGVIADNQRAMDTGTRLVRYWASCILYHPVPKNRYAELRVSRTPGKLSLWSTRLILTAKRSIAAGS